MKMLSATVMLLKMLMKMKMKLLPYCNGQVLLSLVYGDGYGVHGYI